MTTPSGSRGLLATSKGGSSTSGSTSGWEGLQTTLASGSALSVLIEGAEEIRPHHPITCSSRQIALYEDGSMSCDHAATSPGDLRTQYAVNGSIAVLLLELAFKL